MPGIDTKIVISEEDLNKNIDKHRSGELVDEQCQECELTLLVHPNPKKHYCDINKQKKEWNEEDWKEVQLELVSRLNKIVLSKDKDEKKVKEKDLTELLVNNLTLLTEKVEKMTSTNASASPATPKTQVVARRNCPAWTAGISVDVYR